MSKIAIVGEAWGEEEARLGHPFVGPSGRELVNMLAEAGFWPNPKVWASESVRDHWLTQEIFHVTNVFNFRPDRNDIDSLCTNKSGDQSGLPAIRTGKYLQARYLGEIDRLRTELESIRPNVTIALGNTACWALLQNNGISKIRGTVVGSVLCNEAKTLPTYHPAAVLRQYDLRAVTILDLAKARREAEFPEIRRPERQVFLDPNLADLETFYNEHLASASRIAFDIETSGDQITCIGFAPSPRVALVIPFVDARRSGGSYWETAEEERAAWGFVRRVLQSPQPKIAQNGLYDVHYLWVQYGITVTNFEDDSMLMHHALQPESPKSLAFLGSVYTNESSWKLMNSRTSKLKKDE